MTGTPDDKENDSIIIERYNNNIKTGTPIARFKIAAPLTADLEFDGSVIIEASMASDYPTGRTVRAQYTLSADAAKRLHALLGQAIDYPNNLNMCPPKDGKLRLQ